MPAIANHEAAEEIAFAKLRKLDEDNYEQCFRLKASAEKEDFVDSVTYSLAEAWVFYADTRPFAIYDGDSMVGFVSMYVGEEKHQIIHFFIDEYSRAKVWGKVGVYFFRLC